MTKHDAMYAYFSPKIEELLENVLKFNFSAESKDTVAFTTQYSDKIRRRFVRAAEKEYGFAIVITKSYSIEDDDLNLQAMNFAQAFMDWVDEQDKKKNYPEFPENCQIIKLETLQNMPNLAGINVKEGLARYMLQCRLIYHEKEIRA